MALSDRVGDVFVVKPSVFPHIILDKSLLVVNGEQALFFHIGVDD